MGFLLDLRANFARGAALAALALVPAALAASPVPVTMVYPGDEFDWPPSSAVAGYFWLADLAGISVLPATVVDFTVTNITASDVLVSTFQVFANCNSTDAAWADFTLQVDGKSAAWTMVDSGPCLYHDYLNFLLPPRPTRFNVNLTKDKMTAPLLYADLRFGNVLTAIPLPPTLALMLACVGTLTLFWRRRG